MLLREGGDYNYTELNDRKRSSVFGKYQPGGGLRLGRGERIGKKKELDIEDLDKNIKGICKFKKSNWARSN